MQPSSKSTPTYAAATRMTSQPATPAAALLPGPVDEIFVWEILARLPPKPLLRCRAVCRAWRRATSTRDFLLAHHGRQPSLPVVCGFDKAGGHYNDVLAFDHRAAAADARLDNHNLFCLQDSCDGLLVLSASTTTDRPCFAICNPATRQRALLRQPWDASLFNLLGMYLHHPSGQYRLLLYRTSSRFSFAGHLLPEPKTGCYVSALGSDQPPRYVGAGPEAASALGFDTPAVLVRDCLYWSPLQHQSTLVTVFDTAAESFRQMRAPDVPGAKPYVFEMDSKLGIYGYDDAMKVVDIWVLTDYEGEVWEYKHRIELPVTEMVMGRFGRRKGQWDVSVVSTDGAIILLLSRGQWLFHVDVDGQLVHSFHRDGQKLSACGIQLKQTLVPHAFFTALEDYTVNAPPFI